MSTLDIKKYKTVITYLVISVLMIAIDKVYAIFGHGVSSRYMDWMFLFPLIGGALFYLLLGFIIPDAGKAAGYRLFFNLHNSGIALFTVASFLQGICEIAGTNSPYVLYYNILGGAFIAVGLVQLIMIGKKVLLTKE
ncbi:MAG TPA: hypothetical protein VN258_08685 [Mobilitalea sp.]|nr:hypothetical protein [Mobilitalea sp.]